MVEPASDKPEQPDDAMKAIEARLKLALSVIELETWEYDLQTGKLAFSHRWVGAEGYLPGELPSTMATWLAQIHEADQANVKHAVSRVLSGETDEFDSEHRLRHKDGHWIWVHGKGKVIASDANGLPLRLVGVSLDVTDQRKRVEASLQESEQRFRTLIELAPDPVVVHRNGIVLYMNPAALISVGANSAAQVLGKSVLNMVHPDFHALVRQRIQQAIQTGEALPAVQEVFVRLDGTYFYGESLSVPILFDQQAAILVNIRDISERKRHEAEMVDAMKAAEHANLAKSRFLAAASHDLRQPLQAIKLFSNALERSELSQAQRHITNKLAQSIHGLSVLLEALLDLSKLDSGTVTALKEAVDPAAVFQSIGLEFTPLTHAKGLRLRLFRPAETLTLNTDPILLQRLLRNLLDNAIKYTASGGVLIGLRRQGKRARFQIWDSGSGIAEQHLPEIFDEYFQVNNPERDNLKGLGLGLSIVQRLAKLLGTAVRCRSRLGHGSVFEFDLPCLDLASASARSDDNATEPPEANKFHGRLTALIEDNLMIAEALKMSFEAIGSQVVAFSSAEAALADPRCLTADFLISDLRLPGMNGLRLLETIAQKKHGPLCAVLLTGDTSPERVALTRASAWPVLFKPTPFDELVAALLRQRAAP